MASRQTSGTFADRAAAAKLAAASQELLYSLDFLLDGQNYLRELWIIAFFASVALASIALWLTMLKSYAICKDKWSTRGKTLHAAAVRRQLQASSSKAETPTGGGSDETETATDVKPYKVPLIDFRVVVVGAALSGAMHCAGLLCHCLKVGHAAGPLSLFVLHTVRACLFVMAGTVWLPVKADAKSSHASQSISPAAMAALVTVVCDVFEAVRISDSTHLAVYSLLVALAWDFYYLVKVTKLFLVELPGILRESKESFPLKDVLIDFLTPPTRVGADGAVAQGGQRKGR